jgi:ATP-dependent protease ClpP protease subunit
MAARRRLTDLQQLITDIHTNNINYINRDIYLHGYYDGSSEVSEEPGVEYRMATTFVKNLNILQNDDKSSILVYLHTVGGNWQDGIAIYNAIQYSEAPITILAYAECSSMSGIILQAADRRILMPDTTVMIHHGSLGFDTTSIAAKSIVDINEKCCKRMLKIFAKRAINGQFFKERQYSMSKIESYIDRKIKDKGDWFLSAEEAVYYGIADGIYGTAGYENTNKIKTTKKIKW